MSKVSIEQATVHAKENGEKRNGVIMNSESLRYRRYKIYDRKCL